VHPAVIAAFLEGRLARIEASGASAPSEQPGGSDAPPLVRQPPGPGELLELEELTLELLRELPSGAPATTGATAGRKRRSRERNGLPHV